MVISYIQVDHSTVIFQKEKRGWGTYKKITGMQDSNSQDREK